jgi:hypothetical protein
VQSCSSCSLPFDIISAVHLTSCDPAKIVSVKNFNNTEHDAAHDPMIDELNPNSAKGLNASRFRKNKSQTALQNVRSSDEIQQFAVLETHSGDSDSNVSCTRRR